jgi:hypothetical protein
MAYRIAREAVGASGADLADDNPAGHEQELGG